MHEDHTCSLYVQLVCAGCTCGSHVQAVYRVHCLLNRIRVRVRVRGRGALLTRIRHGECGYVRVPATQSCYRDI